MDLHVLRSHDKDALIRTSPAADPTRRQPDEDSKRLCQRLRGAPFPSLRLGPFYDGLPPTEQTANGVVIYTYPGVGSLPSDGDAAMTDAAQHLAFRGLEDDWTALQLGVIGLSTQDENDMLRSLTANRLSHRLISDRDLQLADALALPTIPLQGRRCYERMVLIVARIGDSNQGQIERLFFPLRTPGQSAAQTLAWIRVHGTGARYRRRK